MVRGAAISFAQIIYLSLHSLYGQHKIARLLSYGALPPGFNPLR